MRALYITLIAVLATLPLIRVQCDAQQTSPRDVIDHFWDMDSEGKQLSAAGADEVAAQCLWEKKSWRQPSEITVIKDYSAKVLSVGKDTADVAVSYRLLGRIDSSFNFRRLQIPYSYQAGWPTLFGSHCLNYPSRGVPHPSRFWEGWDYNPQGSGR